MMETLALKEKSCQPGIKSRFLLTSNSPPYTVASPKFNGINWPLASLIKESSIGSSNVFANALNAKKLVPSPYDSKRRSKLLIYVGCISILPMKNVLDTGSNIWALEASLNEGLAVVLEKEALSFLFASSFNS